MNEYTAGFNDYSEHKKEDLFGKFEGYYSRMLYEDWRELIKKSKIENYVQEDTGHYHYFDSDVKQYNLIYNNKVL